MRFLSTLLSWQSLPQPISGSVSKMSPRTPTYPGDSKAVRRVAATLEQLPVFLTNKKADVNDAA
jgi:hypothetical protein